MSADAQQLIAELRRAGTRMRAVNEKRYLKSQAEFFGVPVPKTRALAAPVATLFRSSGNLPGAVAFARVLWTTGAHEPRVAAIAILGECESFFDDRVWDLGFGWLHEIDNWALCDGIGPGLLAPFVQHAHPRFKSRRRQVLRFTKDPNPWVRRGALLATMRSTRIDREWEFLFDVAGRLIEDPDYYVQKGLGWMLRECAQHNPREVITFIQAHRGRMRKSTITNAVSRLPKTLQRAARTGPGRSDRPS